MHPVTRGLPYVSLAVFSALWAAAHPPASGRFAQQSGRPFAHYGANGRPVQSLTGPDTRSLCNRDKRRDSRKSESLRLFPIYLWASAHGARPVHAVAGTDTMRSRTA